MLLDTASSNHRLLFAAVSIAIFSGADVERAVSPHEAYDAVKEAFVAHARGEWTMQPKVYVTNYPAGDFRAMPALGGGHALLKWVTSFPGNPAKGLPTVTGLVILSNSETGELEALLDAAAVTALRTAAAGVIAAETLCREGAESIAVVGCGVNGAETVRMFRALGSEVSVWDVDSARAASVAEMDRADLFCDDWEQASHGGELAAGVAGGVVTRKRVTELGRVLADDAEGRRSARDITLFDSTGLAIQDLAVARAAFAKADELGVTRLTL
jgi:ornithine cyclodeaminase/alanine dehydrogenase-like protein (mu-crystallin family)